MNGSAVLALWLIVVLPTSLWVFIDARGNSVKKGRIEGFYNMGPAGWCFSCLLSWALAFPLYLYKRGAYKRAIAAPAFTAAPVPTAAFDFSPDEIRKFAALRDDGLITEEEFQAKKRALLGL